MRKPEVLFFFSGIYLEFFLDPPRGCGLLDAATSAWTEEARKFRALMSHHACLFNLLVFVSAHLEGCDTTQRDSPEVA